MNKKLFITSMMSFILMTGTLFAQDWTPLNGNLYFNTGKVGIGLTIPSAGLHVNYGSNGQISQKGIYSYLSTQTSTNVTSYDKATYSALLSYTIPAGVSDLGYKIGLDASSYSTNIGFAGTLNNNFGVWARAGIYRASSGAKIHTAIAVNAEILDNVSGATIENAYGVKINTGSYGLTTVNNRYDLYAGTSTAKNYFAGNVGIGTNNPEEQLELYKYETEYSPFEDQGGATLVLNTVYDPTGGWNNHIKVSNSGQGLVFNSTYGYPASTTRFAKLGRFRAEFPGLEVQCGLSNLSFSGAQNQSNDLILTGGNVLFHQKLWVKEEIVIQETCPFPDYVFESDYDLISLSELQSFINKNNHLPEVPSAEHVAENGINVGEMNVILLKKIEELTLYTLEQQKLIDKLQEDVKSIKNNN